MTAPDTTSATWRVEAGQRCTNTFTVLDVDGNVSPVSGWTVDAKIRRFPGGPILYTFPSGDAELLSGGAVVRLTVPESVSLAWKFTSGWYRVRVFDPAAVDPFDKPAQRILQGCLIVDPD